MLAFCEGRRDSRHDYGQIDLLMRRSDDGGASWGPAQVVAREEGMTCGNPAPVADRASGRILLPFCKNLADGGEDLICKGRAPRTVWLTSSDDDGRTWSAPREITEQVKAPNWTWYATGPCHAMQLESGRIVVPCDHVVGVYLDRQRDPHHSHVILSDDGGESWRVGGIAPEGTNECCAVETSTGGLYLNCRNRRTEGAQGALRAYAWSADGGESFTVFGHDPALPEPICQGTVCRYSLARDGDADRVLFANPAGATRANLTLRCSYDECRTWPVARTLHAGPAAYSDLGVAPDGQILCLYERGVAGPYEEIALARLPLGWLTEDREP